MHKGGLSGTVCLNVKVADIRQRMAGIDRAALPTVEQVREQMREHNNAASDTEGSGIAPLDYANDNRKPGVTPRPGSDRQRAALMELALLLQKSPKFERHSINDNADLSETLAAFGFDAKAPATHDKWRELQSKVDAGRISEKDRLREMALHLWQEADKEKRADHGNVDPITSAIKPDRDR